MSKNLCQILFFFELTKSNFFSKIDLPKGYWQILLAEEAKNKTAFVTPDGQFRFCYLPFGLVNAPREIYFVNKSTAYHYP